jgi:D-serine deaminase-like pyridoxal phosphate-dependent protein
MLESFPHLNKRGCSGFSEGIMPEQQRDYLYYRKIFSDLPMPFAFLDLDLLDQNIRDIAARAGGKRIRLASKSLRSTEVLRLILASDPCFQGIMCYTAREAVYLAEQGFDDLLIGYPTCQSGALAAVAAQVATGKHITLMVDALEQIQQAETAAREHSIRLPLCIDIDMSVDFPGLHFGVWRSPLHKAEQLYPLLDYIHKSSSVYLDGLMGYEAQIAGVGDNQRGQMLKNSLIRWLKQRSRREVEARRAQFLKLCHSHGFSLRFVNGGGTGSQTTTREDPSVTEVTVGSGFYSPTLFENFRDFHYQPAIGYAIEIVCRPQAGIYTCQGGGYIASGETGKNKEPQPYLPPEALLTPLEGAGEVQTPIRYTGSVQLQPGDPIFMRHAKAGELCEHFTRLHLVRDGKLAGQFTTYRGAGQCFL